LNEALADYSKVIELEPTHAEALANRAVVEMLQGKNAEAMRDFDQAFKLNPDLREQYKEFIEGQRRKPNQQI
jgi:tetratricopeptide (TPR) repeat protein